MVIYTWDESHRQSQLEHGHRKGPQWWFGTDSMQYTRGYTNEYDLWNADDRNGWSFSKVENYFKTFERFVSTPEREHHGTEGPVACTSLGLQTADDINDPKFPFNVCTKFDRTIDLVGRRGAVLDLHIEEDLNGLQIVKGATIGGDGKIYRAHARLEVVMSAGAIAIPQILLLSGIVKAWRHQAR
ncbi:hypothetical protein CVT25_010508 [Psilocybe cyanescens]|uniref:Uncharacterized protein n=1 Tax=Psilocybe cyanescens TaxID=93625 RepID=A0A409X2L3_PSICY|nr:hypothetical protein CVT25_010508 [Psilocybe cyanescens]